MGIFFLLVYFLSGIVYAGKKRPSQAKITFGKNRFKILFLLVNKVFKVIPPKKVFLL